MPNWQRNELYNKGDLIMNTYNIFLYALSTFFILIILFAVIKTRYKKFTNREFVLRFRFGKLKNQGFGGGYFLLPLIDELIVLTTTVNNLEIDAGALITKENQDVRINGLVIWRIEDPVKAYQSIAGSQQKGVMGQINALLQQLVESIVRTTVAKLTLDQVLRERSLIIEAIMTELVTVVGPMGIKVNTAEIRHVEVVDNDLFSDLQETFRQEARLKAEKIKIDTNREVEKSTTQYKQEVRYYEAERAENARLRELEKDRQVLLQQQKLDETEQLRIRSVREIEKKREAAMVIIEREKLQTIAETRLMEIELAAESAKRKHILEDIEVRAQEKKLMAEAEAEARLLMAKANQEAVELEAKAEAYKVETIAVATKKSMLAEAEGRKAILLAEAEGLREKVQAQGLVNDAMIMQELIQQLPAIASSIKVGDINWLNLGGNGNGKGESPLGIIPKNLIQVMGIAKTFGLDLDGLIASLKGKKPLQSIAKSSEDMVAELIPLDTDIEKLENAILIDLDGDGVPDGIDLNNNGEIDIKLPEGIIPILNSEGQLEGFDINQDGEIDFNFRDYLKSVV